MRTYCLLLLWLIASNLRGSTCCEFPLVYLMAAQEAPEEDELMKCYLNTTCSDKRYFYAGKMINAYQRSEFDTLNKYFDSFLNTINRHPSNDLLNLEIIYFYAKYLEHQGLSNYALPYYQYIKNKSAGNPTLNLLSSISITGISKSEELIVSFKDTIEHRINIENSFSTDDKIVIVLKLLNYFRPNASYTLLAANKNLYKTSTSPTNKFLFLSHLDFYFAQSNDKEYEQIWKHFEKSFAKVDYKKLGPHWETVLARKALSDQEFEQSLNHAKRALEFLIGSFNDHDELMSKIKHTDIILNEYLERYAQSKLYYSRLIKSMEPVKEAFQIYIGAFRNKLQKELNSVSSVYSDKSSYIADTYPNILIVGTYLYQQTGDLRYLNESISVMDGFAGAGSNYWTQVRSLMREDTGFAGLVGRERELAAWLREPAPDVSLAEIREQHRALEAHRQSMRDDYPELYDQLTEGYELNLAELRDELTADTSGLVAFYLNENILYRLFLAKDTIEIRVMNDIRQEALELTETFAREVANGKSAASVREPSRRLYSLLFDGLDSQLPARLHLIAEGQLDDIPFAALRRDTAAGPPRYLGLECALSRQFSIRSMKLLKALEVAPGHHHPLALAPSFKGNLLQASELRQAGFKLPPLLYNGEELSKLEAKGAGKYLYGKAATAAAYKAHAPDYSIIHLATHAISSQTDGLLSRIYLLNDTGEPTSLYASDIGEQTLNADLVVLSACETGAGGRHANEGRIGLTKAYLAAGARAVVASHWAVDDHATAELMDGFYQALETGVPPHEALQTSRRAYLEKFPEAPPYKWAAFGAYGGMEAIAWNRKPAGRTGLLFALAGLFATTVAGYQIYRKKRQAA